MKKYAKIENEETKACSVGVGTNIDFYKSIGMTEMDVEQAYNGTWYITGYAPKKPESEIVADEIIELKNKLTASDYAVIKIAEGAATAEEYADLITQRAAWRLRINELEAQLTK